MTALTCVAMTAKGIVHLPDLDDSVRDQKIFWAAWLLAFTAVPVQWRALNDAMAFVDARAVRAASAAAAAAAASGAGGHLTDPLLDSVEQGSAAAPAGADNDGEDDGDKKKTKKKKVSTLGGGVQVVQSLTQLTHSRFVCSLDWHWRAYAVRVKYTLSTRSNTRCLRGQVSVARGC